MIKNRPDFSPDWSEKEFLKHYWYKTELQKICSTYHLPTFGTKSELQKNILDFLNGNAITCQRKEANKKRIKTVNKPLTLDTKLILEGFKFDQKARTFFAEYYGVSKFSFTKAMASALRVAEINNDLNMTVKDLIDIYENKKKISALLTEESIYQWNYFLKDFHADPNTNNLKNKHQIVTYLWCKVRDTPGEKGYHTRLLKIHEEAINKLENNV